MSAGQDRGYYGEQTAAFRLGQKGYMIVDGPSGSQGHNINAPGFDGLAYNPKTQHLIIYDNKAFKRAGNVSSASALTTNLSKNFGNLLAHVKGMKDLPFKEDIVQRLNVANSAIKTGATLPTKSVELVVIGEGGSASGVTKSLAGKGVTFLSLDKLPNTKGGPPSGGSTKGANAKANVPLTKAVIGSPMEIVVPPSVTRMHQRMATVGAAASAFQQAVLALNAWGLKRRIRKEFEENKEIRNAIWRSWLNGEGTLLIIRIVERRYDAGTVRNLLSIYTQPGRSMEDAKQRWHTPQRLLKGVAGRPPFVVTRDTYQWIPPVAQATKPEKELELQ